MNRVANWPLVWTLVAFAFVLLEGIALGEPQAGDSFSECFAIVRWDPIGRFVALPLACWLAWHLVIRPRTTPLFTWRDAVALAFGLAWAVLESYRVAR